MSAGFGHNRGPSMEPGWAWRKHVWAKARADLIPRLPIEVLRGRIKRAKELGLDYKTYAGIRASTGRDVIGFLFSNNALRVLRQGDPLPRDRHDRLGALNARQFGLAHPPVTPASLAAAAPTLERCQKAPGLWDSPAEATDILKGLLRDAKIPGDGLVLIADTSLERDWSALGRLAGVLGSDTYFQGS